jgi:hypothetical protein
MGFLLIFIIAFVLVSFFLRFFGWYKLERMYAAPKDFKGKRIGIFSGSVNSASYKNVLVLYCDNQGVYLRTLKLFPLFHRPIYIPIEKWKVFTHTTFFNKKHFHLLCNDPVEVSILFSSKEFEKFDGLFKIE